MLTIYAGTSGEELAACDAHRGRDEARRRRHVPAEVARARAQMKAGLLMGLESPSNRAERLARMVQIWGRVPPIEETVARIDAVTRGRSCGLCREQAAQGRRGAGALRPGCGVRRALAELQEVGRPDAAARRRLRIETERLTLRPPLHSDFRPGPRCAQKAAISSPRGSPPGPPTI
jgi:hypothetical protein